ncbi:MAG: TonB-dependent receptor plug domain-containing protein [Candidatus Eisenbacteria bacterium]|nr:TonB-dependent receptor plug domain-containing protein [Candidatus Latescibacterota bacterium]MBD3303468.1 TonB-dependent receptor plug domain-containing protein [Candidatus Eisenbacteria bacterium]
MSVPPNQKARPRPGAGARPFFLLALLAAIAGPARGGAIEGIVIDVDRKNPIPLVAVSAGAKHRTETGEDGRFRLEGLLPGRIEVRVEHVGYDPWSRTVELGEDEETRLMIRLRPRVRTLDPVEVRTTRPDPSVPQGKKTISGMRIRSSAGAVATDPLRVVQSLPGAAAAGDDFSNRYVVRGGDPEESIVRIDGYRLLQPVHLEGFTSVVYDDLISTLEVFPGALPPRYGDALSSVTALRLVDPGFTQKFFRYDLGSVALGGQTDLQRGSVLGAARGSFYNLILRRPPGIDKRSFQDLCVKGSMESAGAVYSVTAVASRDREEGDFDREVDAGLLGLRVESAERERPWRFDVSFGRRDRATIQDRPESEIRGDLRRIAVSGGLRRERGERLVLRADAEARAEWFRDATRSDRSAGGFLALEGTWTAHRVAVSTGLRAERIPFTATVPVSPYVSVRYRGLGRIVPGAGFRIVRQSPFHLHDNPEVGGLPVDPGVLLEAGAGDVEPLEARHFSLGLDADLGGGYSAIMEIYRKEYERLLTWTGTEPTAASLGNDGEGTGKGIEMTLRKEEGRFATGWISYAISKTRKREGFATALHRSDHDRPRMLQAAVEVPIRGGTSVSGAFRASTGRPVTPLFGTGDGSLDAGGINAERLPSYRRLDVKLEHRIDGEKNSAFLYVDVLNVLNRKNTVDVVQFVGAGGEVVRIYTQGVRILPVAGFGFYF